MIPDRCPARRKRVLAEIIWQVLKALAEGLGIRATARVFDLGPDTIKEWLRQVAEHVEAVSHYLIHDLHLSQVQVDELWALLGQQDVDEQSQQPADCVSVLQRICNATVTLASSKGAHFEI